jgi:hypothetical protein
VFDNWIDILQGGSYEVSLPTLTVAGERIGQLRGSGQISWSSDAGIRFQGVTDGAETLNTLLFDGFGTPGFITLGISGAKPGESAC